MLPLHLEHYGILIRCATRDDKPAWISLAEDVAEIFGNPNMPRDAEFHSYMEGKISKNEALIAVTQDTGECLGVIGFSKTHNRITWFGVFEKHRERGIGSELLRLALAQLDSSRSITVETYRAGYAPGEPARHVYHKFGFVDVDNAIYDHLGNPRCRMEIAPGNCRTVTSR